jgi:lysophospholipase L1-like esterase
MKRVTNLKKRITLICYFLFIVVLISIFVPGPVSANEIVDPASSKDDLDALNKSYIPLIIKTTDYLPNKIYCMGDSLTSVDMYQPVLIDLLGPDWVTVNKGISAQYTSQMLSRFQSDIINPGDADYVIIWGGAIDVQSNNTPEETTKSNMQGMYTMAHDAGIKVVAVTITPQNDLPPQNKAKILSINSWMKNTASNIDFIADAYTAVEDPNKPGFILPAYDQDGVHFNSLGYTAVAETIYNSVAWIP